MRLSHARVKWANAFHGRTNGDTPQKSRRVCILHVLTAEIAKHVQIFIRLHHSVSEIKPNMKNAHAHMQKHTRRDVLLCHARVKWANAFHGRTNGDTPHKSRRARIFHALTAEIMKHVQICIRLHHSVSEIKPHMKMVLNANSGNIIFMVRITCVRNIFVDLPT